MCTPRDRTIANQIDGFIAYHLQVYRSGGVSAEALARSNISWQDIFEEIPICIANSTLHSVLMNEIETENSANQVQPFVLYALWIVSSNSAQWVEFMSCLGVCHSIAVHVQFLYNHVSTSYCAGR